MSFAGRMGLLGCLVLLVTVGGSTAVLIRETASRLEQSIVERDKDLAKLLGGLRTTKDEVDFATLRLFVENADRVDMGLVYAMEIERGGALLQGALNPRLFGNLGPTFQRLMVEHGRQGVLAQLAAGRVNRQGHIREFKLHGYRLRLGFDVAHIDRQVRQVYWKGLWMGGAGLLVGIGLWLVLGRWLAAPVEQLSREAAKAAGIEAGGEELALIKQGLRRITALLGEQQNVSSHLRPYLAPGVLERLLQAESSFELATEERGVTVLALEFRGCTTFQSGLDASSALRLLNEYLAPVIEAIVEHQGTVLEMRAGRVLAVWGTPAPVKEPELQAIRAGLAARAAARQEARRQSAVGGVALEPSLGIAAGRAVAGNLGSARQLQYGLVGGAVEQAEMILGLAQPGEVVANEAAFSKARAQLRGAACAPLIIEGLEEVIPLYRVEHAEAGPLQRSSS